MQFFALAALFAGSSMAAKYAAGAPCHSNVECNKNCLDGKWTITHEDDDYFLSCDAATPDPTQYYGGQCQKDSMIPMGSHSSGPMYDAPSTSMACTAVGGTDCSFGCIVTGKRSVDGDTRNAWEKACKSAGNATPNFVKYASEGQAKIISSC